MPTTPSASTTTAFSTSTFQVFTLSAAFQIFTVSAVLQAPAVSEILAPGPRTPEILIPETVGHRAGRAHRPVDDIAPAPPVVSGALYGRAVHPRMYGEVTPPVGRPRDGVTPPLRS
ncbi:hypothetical protein Psi01_46280 [Planobispora siamensis]|uniref:Uncharacterized protein n=1 Tax=Planobispora siamensis TaxID=936338 RepID=A0A8J3SGR9_9ACTN|nr:hypothetical protein Psi01_46280 [Planobispora siamensis]